MRIYKATWGQATPVDRQLFNSPLVLEVGDKTVGSVAKHRGIAIKAPWKGCVHIFDPATTGIDRAM